MVIQLIYKGLFKVTMGTEVEPDSTVENSKYFKRLDEEFGLSCLSISRDILFHVDILTTQNDVWQKLEALFGTTNQLRGHHLENELIFLSLTHFETIQDFFTKFKSLVLQLKQCGIEKKMDQLIMSILLKLGPKIFSVCKHLPFQQIDTSKLENANTSQLHGVPHLGERKDISNGHHQS